MSYDALLVHTAEVRRKTGRADRFGQPVEANPSAAADAIYDCRLTMARGGERYQDRSRGVVEEQFRLFLQPDAELFESDRVTVRNRDGRILVLNADVTYVSAPEDATGPHHIEAKLRSQRSSDDARPG